MLKYFVDNKERLDNMYSYELAKNFAKNMQRLQDDTTLVHFLDIVIEIGEYVFKDMLLSAECFTL